MQESIASCSSAGIFQQVSTGTETPKPKGVCLRVCFRVGISGKKNPTRSGALQVLSYA